MLLGDKDSYHEDLEASNLLKGEKGKTRDTHSNDLSPLFKNSTENNNDGSVVGQKRPITNNVCFQNLAKTVSYVKVYLETLNQADQEHQIPQNLGDAVSERLASVIKIHC